MVDNNYFIDKETFEVYETSPHTFNCDKKIAYAIAELNKKGYKTGASCSGHYKIEYQEELNVDKSFLEECQNNPRCIIREIRDNDFDVWTEYDYTIMYVAFSNRYDFENLPLGFALDEYTEYFSNTRIRHLIKFYNEDGKRKSQQKIVDEIDKYCNILKNWAMELPLNENKERKI